MVERARLNRELRGDVGRRDEAVGAILGAPGKPGVGYGDTQWSEGRRITAQEPPRASGWK